MGESQHEGFVNQEQMRDRTVMVMVKDEVTSRGIDGNN